MFLFSASNAEQFFRTILDCRSSIGKCKKFDERSAWQAASCVRMQDKHNQVFLFSLHFCKGNRLLHQMCSLDERRRGCMTIIPLIYRAIYESWFISPLHECNYRMMRRMVGKENVIRDVFRTRIWISFSEMAGTREWNFDRGLWQSLTQVQSFKDSSHLGGISSWFLTVLKYIFFFHFPGDNCNL